MSQIVKVCSNNMERMTHTTKGGVKCAPLTTMFSTKVNRKVLEKECNLRPAGVHLYPNNNNTYINVITSQGVVLTVRKDGLKKLKKAA
jgi:hypothetical protein